LSNPEFVKRTGFTAKAPALAETISGPCRGRRTKLGGYKKIISLQHPLSTGEPRSSTSLGRDGDGRGRGCLHDENAIWTSKGSDK